MALKLGGMQCNHFMVACTISRSNAAFSFPYNSGKLVFRQLTVYRDYWGEMPNQNAATNKRHNIHKNASESQKEISLL